MTRPEARQVLHDLAGGLEATDAGVWRLLERIAAHEEAEALRDLLVEVGARAVLDGDDR